MSVFTSLFSRDPKANFAYDLPSISFFSSDGISIGKSFKKADPTELATCFWASSSDYGGAPKLKLQAQKLKTMRHPNVLTYIDSIEIDGTFYLITETCTPLSLYMDSTKFVGSQKDFVASWGFFQLMNCLKFLHNEAKLSHENLRKSVYVTEGGDWKVSGLEGSTTFSNSRNDLNALGFLIWEVFNGFNDSLTKPSAPGKMPKQLHEFYKKCATPQAAKLSTAEFLTECRRPGGFFKNRFVDTLLFLEEFQLKDPHDKQVFFSKLKDELDIFPDDIAKCKILPTLIQTYEYGDAGSHILLPLFKLGRLLEEDEYQRRIVPCLCKLFSSPDRATRVKLLEKIDEFAPHLTTQVVNDKIYGNLAPGFLDTNPAVRESTVKAMVSLAEKLNYHNLNTDLMKYLARLQGSDDQPGIRTNTTICLGKIGCYIDPSQRQRILISAFTRALKDPFPPSRIAALLAISATQQYYSLIEVANKILPALAPLTCDPEKQVRDQGFKALRGFIEKLEKASENPEMIPELEAQVQAGGKSGLLSSDKVPQWASWALKSLSGKFYKGTPSHPAVNPVAAKSQQESSVASSRDTTPAVEKIGEKTADKASAHVDSSSDGWDDLKDDFIEETSDTAEKWEDVNEPSAADTGDWSSGWKDEEEPFKSLSPNPKTVTKSFDFKPSAEEKTRYSDSGWGVEKEQFGSRPKTAAKGGLKLQPAVKKPPEEEDLDFLLGVTPEPKPKPAATRTDSRRSSKSDSKPSGDLWGANSEGYSWNDFSEKPKSAANTSSGWDADWADETPKPPEKDARRAEMAARNEARKKQLAAKRTAKSTGAVRLGANKPS